MSMFEYVAVLTSIIVGLSIARLLQGVAGLIQHPGRRKIYWVHLVWVLNLFFTAVYWWWWEFHFSVVETWTLQLYLFVVFYAVLIYILCALLFPSDLDGYTGFEDYFLSRRRWFFGCSAVNELVDLADTRLKGAEHFASQGMEYLISAVVTLALYIFAMFSENRKFHAAFALLSLVYLLSFAFRYHETIW